MDIFPAFAKLLAREHIPEVKAILHTTIAVPSTSKALAKAQEAAAVRAKPRDHGLGPMFFHILTSIVEGILVDAGAGGSGGGRRQAGRQDQ